MKFNTGAVFRFTNKENENDICYLHLFEYELILGKFFDLVQLFPQELSLYEILNDRELKVGFDIKKTMEKYNVEKLIVQRVQITEIQQVYKNIKYERGEY